MQVDNLPTARPLMQTIADVTGVGVVVAPEAALAVDRVAAIRFSVFVPSKMQQTPAGIALAPQRFRVVIAIPRTTAMCTRQCVRRTRKSI